MLQSINPATGKEIKSYEEMNEDNVKEIIDSVDSTFNIWRKTSFKERSEKMNRAAEIIKEKKEEFAILMVEEMGKPIAQARAEAEKCAWVCEYYAENAEKFLEDEKFETDADNSFVTYQPLGVVLAIMPWNFPFWQVFRFAAPNLMAGNAALLKHASNVQSCALSIESIFREAGFPENLFRTILISSKKVKNVIDNGKVRAVTLTGSVPAGKVVAREAGEQLKKTVLELGGSDPYVILEDADLEKAADTCVTSRLINAGQSCIAAKRFIIPEKIYNDFEKLFVEKMKQKKMGDPKDEENDLGPQARDDLRDDLHKQVEDSVEKGAKILLGGKVPDMKGAYYPPTVLANVEPGMPAYDEELFGPVAALIKVKDEEEAIKVANDSDFGLGGAVFTKDVDRGTKIAREKIDSGNVFVNQFVKSDPRLPFGGVKDSGYGRELSIFGIKEFVNIKTVYVDNL